MPSMHALQTQNLYLSRNKQKKKMVHLDTFC